MLLVSELDLPIDVASSNEAEKRRGLAVSPGFMGGRPPPILLCPILFFGGVNPPIEIGNPENPQK